MRKCRPTRAIYALYGARRRMAVAHTVAASHRQWSCLLECLHGGRAGGAGPDGKPAGIGISPSAPSEVYNGQTQARMAPECGGTWIVGGVRRAPRIHEYPSHP